MRVYVCLCLILSSPPPGSIHILGECELYKEERNVLEKMRKIDGCDMEKFVY